MSTDEARWDGESINFGLLKLVHVSKPFCRNKMQAIEGLQTGLEDKFVYFQAEVHQEQEEAAAKTLKTAKYKKPYVYQRKGNEVQAMFNTRRIKPWPKPKATSPMFHRVQVLLLLYAES